MTLRVLILSLSALFAAGCAVNHQAPASTSQTKSQSDHRNLTVDNPFLAPYDTPFGVPPFHLIDEAHYLPALETGIEQNEAEIAAITNNPAAPTFANTVEALERSGELIRNVTLVFYPLNSASSNDQMQAIAKQMGPALSRHRDNINLSEKLFARVRAVYEGAERDTLNEHQQRLLEETYKSFVRGGANLTAAQKSELRKLNSELSSLSIQFGENVLKSITNFKLVLSDEAELAGLPDNLVTAAAEAADAAGLNGQWVITLDRSSVEPFLQYSTNRALRERAYKGYIQKANNGDEQDNNAIAAKIAALRAQRAQLLGFATHAHYVLDVNMAKTPENVYALLNKMWQPALNRAREEVAQMQEIADAEGADIEIAAWDWRYYAEKVRKAKYDFDADQLRPYFEISNVIDGAFMVANKLYGITFTQRDDLPKYHEDVLTYEVREANGDLLGIYYSDWHPRTGKRGGAWMNSFRKQHIGPDGPVLPVITNVGNFTKPTAAQPALLRFSEVNTLFHEFGHALHGLLSDGYYNRLTGTAVTRDFVEFPSQVMENWASSPQVLKLYARHYQTGATIPDALLAKIKKSAKFNQGFSTTEYIAAALLDLDWHTLTTPKVHDAPAFEAASIKRMGLIPQIDPRYRTTYFNHIFAGGYAAGYYSYLWSEVLDADAFKAFEDSGDLFNPQLAKRFRDEILARGGVADGMDLYKNFRGSEPSTQPLIERRGLGQAGD